MLTFFANLALRILAMYLGNRADAKESNKRFIDFLEAMSREGLTSVRLKQSADGQLDRLNELKDKIDRGDTLGDKVDSDKIKIIVPDIVKKDELFEVSIIGMDPTSLLGIHVFAERKHFVASIQPPTFSSKIKLSGTGKRTLGFEIEKGVWVEATTNVVS